jgi:hypothetical protein
MLLGSVFLVLLATHMFDYAIESTRRSLASPQSAVEVVTGDVRTVLQAVGDTIRRLE